MTTRWCSTLPERCPRHLDAGADSVTFAAQVPVLPLHGVMDLEVKLSVSARSDLVALMGPSGRFDYGRFRQRHSRLLNGASSNSSTVIRLDAWR